VAVDPKLLMATSSIFSSKKLMKLATALESAPPPPPPQGGRAGQRTRSIQYESHDQWQPCLPNFVEALCNGQTVCVCVTERRDIATRRHRAIREILPRTGWRVGKHHMVGNLRYRWPRNRDRTVRVHVNVLNEEIRLRLRQAGESKDPNQSEADRAQISLLFRACPQTGIRGKQLLEL
jgi:hypothetical protein